VQLLESKIIERLTENKLNSIRCWQGNGTNFKTHREHVPKTGFPTLTAEVTKLSSKKYGTTFLFQKMIGIRKTISHYRKFHWLMAGNRRNKRGRILQSRAGNPKPRFKKFNINPNPQNYQAKRIYVGFRNQPLLLGRWKTVKQRAQTRMTCKFTQGNEIY